MELLNLAICFARNSFIKSECLCSPVGFGDFSLLLEFVVLAGAEGFLAVKPSIGGAVGIPPIGGAGGIPPRIIFGVS